MEAQTVIGLILGFLDAIGILVIVKGALAVVFALAFIGLAARFLRRAG